MRQISTGKLREWSYLREIIGQLKPITADIVPYEYIAEYTVANIWRYPIRCRVTKANALELGDNCIQNFHFGRYIVGYTVGNIVLQRRESRAVKRDFRTYIRRYTSPNENFEYGYPHSNALLQSHLKLERCEPHKAAQMCRLSNETRRN